MGEEVKIGETKTLATDDEGKAVETPDEGGEAATDGGEVGDGDEAAE